MSIKKVAIFLFIILTVLPAAAQDTPSLDDSVTVTDIAYDSVVQDSITTKAFYDWWRIDVTAGDVMVIEMGGEDGLAPLIGVLDSTGSLVARSTDGEPNQTVSLDYKVPSDGQYTIVATRVSNADGTTTGRYALRVRKANASEVTDSDQYEDVTFACQNFEATTVATLKFADDPRPNLRYRITVYGIGGFEPVIRLKFDVTGQDPYETCNTNANATIDDTYTVPGEPKRTVTKDTLSNVSQLIFTGADKAGFVTVTIASKNGTAGRYFAVLDGFSIDSPSNTDLFDVRIGPLAKLTPLTVYMVAAENSRLDPYMKWGAGNMECDDAGRDTCKNVMTFNKAGATLHERGGTTIVGDRSDAGLVLAPGNTDIMTLELGSRLSQTSGDYAVFLLGELPSSK